DLAALPPPPSRAVEMLDDRIVLMVYDKAVLDEEDVANATAIVWGNAQEAQLRPIGPRGFVTPGWVTVPSGPFVALMDCHEDAIVCSLRDRSGKVKQEHRAPISRGARVGVQ